MNTLMKILKLITICTLFTYAIVALTGCNASSSHAKKIGIIVPLENKALDEIVAGFTETLQKQSSQPLSFKVANAQGDMNLQRAIIQQMKDEHFDIVAPIGTTATQMTAAAIQDQTIVSLAASFSQQDRAQRKVCNIAVVHDEISPRQIIAFIHQVYPNITKLTLVHSASDKIFPDVKVVVAAGKELGIDIKPMMAPTLNDLYSVANSIPQDSQGIFVLKDILITSGISTLANVAEKHHIPLMTSDQGSVQDGAAFAVGVHEKQIGEEGGKLAAAALAGKSACSLPIVEMTRLTAFVNKASLTKEGQVADPIQVAAKQAHYAIEYVDATNGAK